MSLTLNRSVLVAHRDSLAKYAAALRCRNSTCCWSRAFSRCGRRVLLVGRQPTMSQRSILWWCRRRAFASRTHVRSKVGTDIQLPRELRETHASRLPLHHAPHGFQFELRTNRRVRSV